MKIPLVFALVGALGGAVWAQPKPVKDAPVLAPVEQPVSRTYSIPIRNVKASLMAFWLDPANHETPIELGQFAPKTTRSAPPGKGGFQLPDGVTRIIAVDPQNALLVFGTAEGVERLRSTIAFLDRPLRQVEIEAQFVQVNTADLSAFGIDAKPGFNTPQSNRMIGFVRGNFSAALTALIKEGKAKILSSPRVTAINNLTASLSQGSTTPVEIGVRDAAGILRPLEDANSLEGAPLFVRSQMKLEVTPTINNDDTITVLMDSGITRNLMTNESVAAPDLKKDSSLKTIANVRDGETIALGGTRFNQSNAIIVLLVTARIVRRAGE